MGRLREALKDAPLLGRLCRWLYGWATFPRQLKVAQSNALSVALELARIDGELRAKSHASLDTARNEAPRPLDTTSRLCTQEQFLTPEYEFWCRKIKHEPVWHRKFWEYYFISQVLWERSMLESGRRGCGFGVGREPLSALFAGLGCKIVATDAPSSEVGQHWRKTGQYAASLETLNPDGLCPQETFHSNVEYRPVDMKNIPADLAGFDFAWSACAMEHLGDIEKGIQFALNSCRCLKPNGIAVHTTEFNVSSNDKTRDRDPVVLFRQKDILELGRRLRDIGCELAPVDFSPGDKFLDKFIPPPPYDYSQITVPMLRMMVGKYVTTSIGLIVHKSAG